MSRVDPSVSSSSRLWVLAVSLMLFLTACSSSVSPPKMPGVDYQQAKLMFQQGNLDRALSLTDPVASGSQGNSDTLNARVLRAVIFSGRIRAYKEVADACKKGSQTVANPRFRTSYDRRRSNALQYGSNAALNLGEVVMALASDFPKEVTLDAPWPSAEGPEVVAALTKIRQGGWVPEDEQDTAVLDAQHQAIDDVLAELFGGDRNKARMAMSAGPAKIDGLDFALFLEKQMVDGLDFFGPKYLGSPGQLKTLCGVAERLIPTIATLLKAKPDKAKDAEFKKLQKQIKDAEKYT
ncbi:MAG TPA: hypothetical protein VNG91_01385 [Terriglobia bacterium]|nr:hypothetical protein [Terriglobia bacterium]